MMRELQPGDPQRVGPYRLRGRLGTGGMGQVYLGLSPGGRQLAVKVLGARARGSVRAADQAGPGARADQHAGLPGLVRAGRRRRG
jgi:hypothetical protein